VNRSALHPRRRLASPHHRNSGRGWLDILALSLRLAAVTLLSGIIWIHLHLWQLGYRHIPTIGPLFLAGAISSLAVTAVLLVRPSRLVGLLALVVDQALLVSLIASINIDLFGFQESLNAPFVVESVALEAMAAAALVLWVAVDLAAESRFRRTTVTPSLHPEERMQHAERRRDRRANAETGLVRTLDLRLVNECHGHDAA
jgi:hypothetical protein